MRTPGFTAERGLYPAGGLRNAAGSATGDDRARVVPQLCYQATEDGPVTCVDCITVAGHHLCVLTTLRPWVTHH